MNGSTILRILRALAILAVLALAAVGLEHTVATLAQGRDSDPTAQARVVRFEAPTATVAPPRAQVQVAAQPTATATIAPPPPATATVAPPPPATATVAPPRAQIQVVAQPTVTAPVAAPPSAQVEVEGLITAVDPAAGTITVQDDDGGPATVVALGTAGGTYYAGQDVKVYGTATSAGSNGATVQAQYISLDSPDGDGGDNDGGDNDGD